jgi:hypothetical protein
VATDYKITRLTTIAKVIKRLAETADACMFQKTLDIDLPLAAIHASERSNISDFAFHHLLDEWQKGTHPQKFPVPRPDDFCSLIAQPLRLPCCHILRERLGTNRMVTQINFHPH